MPRPLRCAPLLPALLLVACASIVGRASAAEPEAIAPTETIRLFDTNDLSRFTVWLKETGHDDPKGVFTVKDGVLHVSGEGNGYVATKQPYKDYRLTLEYKWGTKRSNTSKYVRNSGVLLHGVGPDGAANGTWMTSIEVQLAQGCEGDVIVIRGKDAAGQAYPATVTSNTVLASDKKTRWSPDGTPTKYSGRQFWWSKHEPGFQELLDTRGKEDAASPVGEWTKVECRCAGPKITIAINGTVVNEVYDVHPAAGRILLQNEQYEVFFRNVEIGPLK